MNHQVVNIDSWEEIEPDCPLSQHRLSAGRSVPSDNGIIIEYPQVEVYQVTMGLS